MATKRFTGGATAVKQVNTVTPANVGVGNTFSVTIGGKTYTYTAAAATVADVTAGLKALITANAAGHLEWAEVTAQDNVTALALTSTVAGRAFVQTSSATGGTATLTTATTTANAGPNDWNSTANWDTGAIPVDGDDIVIENSAIDISYGLDQSAIQPASLSIPASYTGKIGLPKRNKAGYNEYRDDYLKIGPVTCTIGLGAGSGSPLLKLNFGADTVTALNVYGTGQSAEAGYEALLIRGGTITAANVFKGSVGIAVFGSETCTITTLRTGFITNQAGDAQARGGLGLTLTTLTQNGGTVELNNNLVTVTKTAGTLTLNGTATVTTLNEFGGTTYYRSSGLCGTLNVAAEGTVNYSQDMRARTVTNANFYSDSTVLDPSKTVTWSNPAAFVDCDLKPYDAHGVTLSLGSGFHLQPSA